jgi:Rrf2 family transcriptional regulator, iron-sulfur cluster assembly transcription factor
MRLTTKGRFAVTAMIDLALRDTNGPVTLAAISERQGISLSYLEQLFGKLRRHQIVESVRGPGGGYSMAKTLDSVTVADIIAAVDEPLDATMCGGEKDCHERGRVGGGLSDSRQQGQCMTHELWATLNVKMHEYLRSVSLGDLVRKQKERDSGNATNGQPQAVIVNRSKPAGRTPVLA